MRTAARSTSRSQWIARHRFLPGASVAGERSRSQDGARHDPPEFSQWQWTQPEELPDLIVPFKKRVYRAVLDEFRDLI